MPELVRTLRLRDLLLLFIGSVIGSGIFRTPGPILRQVNGSVGLSLLVWVAGGALSLLGALTYAELACANPQAGRLHWYIPYGFGVVHPGLGLWSNFGLAMIAVLWAYEGWQFGTYSAGEVINPKKAFPRAFLMGSLILVGLYLLAVVAYLFALGPDEMAMSETIAATSVTAVLGSWAGKIVALTILISTFSAANSVILTAPRVFYAMANDKLFFKKLAEVHPRFLTPAAAK